MYPNPEKVSSSSIFNLNMRHFDKAINDVRGRAQLVLPRVRNVRLSASSLIGSQSSPKAIKRIEDITYRIQSCSPQDRLKLLLEAGRAASLASPPFPDEEKIAVNRVLGCTSQVWITARLDDKGHLQFKGTSDSTLTLGKRRDRSSLSSLLNLPT